MVRSSLALVQPPSPIVVVAEAWPGVLVSLLALKLPIGGAFFPKGFHSYFSYHQNKHEVSPWQPTLAFTSSVFTQDHVFFLSGSMEFIQKVWPVVQGFTHVITSIDFNRHQRHYQRALPRSLKRGRLFLEGLGLSVSTYKDALCGGATSNEFIVGFSSAFGTGPTLKPDVPRAL